MPSEESQQNRYCTHLLLEIKLNLLEHVDAQVTGERILQTMRTSRIAESTELVTPQHDGLFDGLAVILGFDRDGKLIFDERHGWHERFASTGK